jgi:phage-related protein
VTYDRRTHRRQWRDYRTAAGGRPVKKYLMDLTSNERAEIVAAMKEVQRDGIRAAKHLRGDVYEVKADTADKFFRVLFATEGRHGQVLLSLEAFTKKTRKTPAAKLELAEKRLKDWRRRGTAAKRRSTQPSSGRRKRP